VLGDVNPGAELVVQGSVIIWGRLRGAVHAGSGGDADAVVCSLEIAPMKLQIADHIWEMPAGDLEARPGMARVRDGGIVIEAWQAAGTGQS
jgi:septum site-determining protein MinC